jgi:hypothetical protein
LAAATLKEVRREAGQMLEGSREILSPFTLPNFIRTLRDLDSLHTKARIPRALHGFPVSAPKYLT